MMRTKLWIFCAAILATVAFAAVAAGSQQADAITGCNGTWWTNKTDLYLNEPVPEFGFSTCEGDELEITDLESKPLLINFWATWCGPCVKEIPNFIDTHEVHGDDVTILGISVDKNPEIVRSFLSEKPLPYLLAWDSAGIARDLGIRTIPFTIAVDAEGKVAGVHQGYASNEDLEKLMKYALREIEFGME